MNSKKYSKNKAIEILTKRMNAMPDLASASSESSEFKGWHKNTRYAIRELFSPGNDELIEFGCIEFEVDAFYEDPLDPGAVRHAYQEGLKEAGIFLKSLIERAEDFWPQENNSMKSIGAKHNVDRDSVFIVHGHNKQAKEEVARFLEKHQLETVILREKVNKGRTIIEKIEENDDVGYAVVLLTPDDICASKSSSNDWKPRARQNVIFEFGYFISKLGRAKVIALLVDEIEKPSDYDGVLYIKMDEAGGWKMNLLKELRNAGAKIDANRELGT